MSHQPAMPLRRPRRSVPTVTRYMVPRREIGSSMIAKGAMSAATTHAGAGAGGGRSSAGTLRLVKTL
jgi:hypothetical protein